MSAQKIAIGILLFICLILVGVVIYLCVSKSSSPPQLKGFQNKSLTKSLTSPWNIPTYYKYCYSDLKSGQCGSFSPVSDAIVSDTETNPIIKITMNTGYNVKIYRAVGDANATFYELNVVVNLDGTFTDTFHPSTGCTPPTKTIYNDKITLLNERYFFSNTSIDGKNGVDMEGKCTIDSIEVNQGFTTQKDLEMNKLTFPFGHSYYKQNLDGYINCESWNVYIKTLKTATNVVNPALLPALDVEITPTTQPNVLVIQNQCLAILDKSITVKGIVVRTGGVLLIDDSEEISIDTEFILVESGGLLQAGCNYVDKLRFSNKLTITLTNPTYGYRYMGVVASQYSCAVYSPGAGDKLDETGELLMMNTFGAKVIAVGFNGTLHFAGLVGSPLPYNGTWGATDITDPSNPQPWVNEKRLLTWFDPTNPDEIAKAKKLNISTSYPNVWCRLEDGLYNKGVNVIKLDARDVQEGVLSQWTPGSKIVLTCKTDIFQQDANISGMVPIWLDYDKDTANYNGNVESNTEKFQSEATIDNKYLYNLQKTNTGVEVATIKSVDGNTIYLETVLQFDHNSTRDILKNTAVGKTIRVDTNTHVALLTRNILITSQRTLDPGLSSTYDTRGCNLWEESKSGVSGSYNGPGGHVVCNYTDDLASANPTLCYSQRTGTYYERYCGTDAQTKIQTDTIQGHWLIGTHGLQGCNAIQGGSTMFRYGSSIALDAVELKYMGQPANFGTIGRYAIHFHLAGWIKSFKGYLPSLETDEYSREGLVANCSLWCCPSRWVVTHGSSELTIRNNVGFISYGSGYFVEDGTELYNQFEHNTAICCLTTVKNDYWNPIPIFGNTSSDLAVMSCYWFKNSQTISLRNLGCNSPGSTLHTWYVPQLISNSVSEKGINHIYSPPSGLCTGDEILKLPTIGGTDNDTCYFPQYMIDANRNKITTPNNCLAFIGINTDNPYIMSSENIAYCLCGGMSEFPEGLSMPPGKFTGSNKLFINQPKDGDMNAQFLAYNGENACTDRFVGTYSQTMWGAGNKKYAYQPLTDQQIATYKSTNAAVTTQNENTNLVPKIFSHWLTFNLGPDGNALFGGAAWIKQSAAFLIGCCALKTGGGISYPNVNTTVGDNHILQDTSTNWAMLIAINPTDTLPNGYAVIYDHITNGKICIPSTPTYIGGTSTFLDDNTSTSTDVEFTYVKDVTSVFYISDNLLPYFKCKADITSFNNFWVGFNVANNNNKIRIYDVDNDTCYDNNVVNSQCTSLSNTNKYPYMCSDSGELRKDDTDQSIVINTQLQAFINPRGVDLGNTICKNLRLMIGCDVSPTGNKSQIRHCSNGNFK